MQTFVLHFNEINQTSLPHVGGKGANLGELTKAGFPVPQGFCVTTSAYQTFVNASAEMKRFYEELNQVHADDLRVIRMLGQKIRHHLDNLPIPRDVECAIVEAWELYGTEKGYAIRSSATAEDLPSASFAGQQETYLNVLGQQQLITAVRRCFASLFTDRAIAYRTKNGFDHRDVLLSVVVQEMVFPEVSGIMFTADPITGNRNVTAIDASFGLGEALVSGLVSADLYQVRGGQIIQKKISDKKIAIYSDPEGGTVTKNLPPWQQRAQALPDERIAELSELGQRIERHYGIEQDIEWCLADGKLYIVQSRPITSLYPVRRFTDNRLHILASVGHVQMMTDAMKPLALSIFESFVPIVHAVGGRLYADITPILENRWLQKRIPRILSNMDEQLGAALHEAAYCVGGKISTGDIPVWKVASFVRPVAKTIIKNLLFSNPTEGPEIVADLIERSVNTCRERMSGLMGLDRLRAVQEDLRIEMPKILPRVVPYWLTSVVASILLKKLLDKWLGESEILRLLNRSLSGNVTSELGLMIGDLADKVRQNHQLAKYLQTAMDENFYAGLKEIPGGSQFEEDLARFMAKYGMRCPGEIDISRPRWRESPMALVPAILGHVRTVEPGEHRTKFAEGANLSEDAARDIIARIRKKGPLKAKIVSRLIDVYRHLGGLREHHKYLAVQHFDIYRLMFLDEANDLVHDGVLAEPSDVFYLSMNELSELKTPEARQHVRQLVSERKAQHKINEKLMPPRVMTSEGEIITGRKRDVHAPQGALIGTPVSPGVVEGHAKVVLRPEEADLNPGEIMIAPFTDPGWTPLFHSAKALVMEVGGLMTHGAVVAREYGIPAVVGIDKATVRIQNGDYIRVDGSEGYVQVLQKSTT